MAVKLILTMLYLYSGSKTILNYALSSGSKTILNYALSSGSKTILNYALSSGSEIKSQKYVVSN